jgi:predicted RNase H-like HicB family nuclease
VEYIAYLHKDKNSDYGVSFPDFPGCVTAGSTLEEARSMAAEALALHVAGMREDGEEVPEPSTLDDLRAHPAMKGAVASWPNSANRREPSASTSPPAKARFPRSTAAPARVGLPAPPTSCKAPSKRKLSRASVLSPMFIS